MKKTRKITSLVAIVLSALLLFATFAACDTDKPDGGKDPVIKEISVNQTSKEIDQGDSFVLEVTAKYDNGTSGRIYSRNGLTFESSAPTVATVGASGSVLGVAKGTATITAKVEKLSATCEVTVHALTLELSETELMLEKDTSKTLTATVKRDGTVLTGDDAKVKWESDNTTVATVNDDGLVTAKSVGTANIKATKGGLEETCALEVTWTPPVGYNEIMWCEQNKLEPNTWGYWNSKESGWANGGLAEDYGVYTDETFKESEATLNEGFEYIGMGKITFEYEITHEGPNYTYQAFYRSSDNVEGGKLHYNHVYQVTFKALSTVGGEMHVNPYDDVRAQNDGESEEDYEAYLATRAATGKYQKNHDFELVANVEQEISVIFRHDDCGNIYKVAVYDNMGSALHLQLGDFPVGEKVTLAIWDFQYKDLGAADHPVTCDETKHADYVDTDAPVIPDVPELILTPAEIYATEAKLRVKGEGDEARAIFQLYGVIDVSKFDDKTAAEEWLYACYFDLQIAGGSWKLEQFNREVVSLDESSGEFLIEYDITRLTVSTGDGSGAYGGHFARKDPSEDGYGDNQNRDLKLDADKAVAGTSITVGNKKYTIVNHKDFEATEGNAWGQAFNYGCVAIKVESV